MKTQFLFVLFCFIMPVAIFSQNDGEDTIWTLEECIQYALKENIQVRRSDLTNKSNVINIEYNKAQRLPSLNASRHYNFNWGNQVDLTTHETNFLGSVYINYSLSSSVTLFNGFSLSNRIKQAKLDFESGTYNSETIKESVSMSILDAFLQVLFTEEQVKNSEKQLESTLEQLNLAEERLNLSIISQSDYLQVKSQLASEKLALANARSQFTIAKVNLMQLMELPVSDDFTFAHPELDYSMNQDLIPDAKSVFSTALNIKPQIKNAILNKESATIDKKIAIAGYIPYLYMNAGLGTDYYSMINDLGDFSQLYDRINPSIYIAFTISVPIFQKKQAKTSVSNAHIEIQNAELSETEVKNQLRKKIEQACVDVTSAQIEYEASQEQFQANKESYALATEKFEQGLINSVDFLFEKTNLIVAESQLLQSKYNLIFSYKILDFYTGVPLTL
jgi:outer membrane protein